MKIDNAIIQNIKSRRTTKAAQMNGQKISTDIIFEILNAADAAPTHARTEPWRLYLYSNSGLENFCNIHAKLYWDHIDETKRTATNRDALANNHKYASHLVIMVMKRTPNARIPWEEEYAACCAAVQNIMLAAHSYGVDSIWSTGGMTYHPELKKYFNLEEGDRIVGQIYLGYSNKDNYELVRKIPMSEKIIENYKA